MKAWLTPSQTHPNFSIVVYKKNSFIIISIVDKDAFSSMKGKNRGCNWPFPSNVQPLMSVLWCQHIAPCGHPLSILLLNPMKNPDFWFVLSRRQWPYLQNVTCNCIHLNHICGLYVLAPTYSHIFRHVLGFTNFERGL